MPVTLTNLTADLLKDQLQQAGYGRCLLLQDQIKNLLLEYQQVQQKIKQQLQAEGHVLKYKVAERVRAYYPPPTPDAAWLDTLALVTLSGTIEGLRALIKSLETGDPVAPWCPADLWDSGEVTL